MEQPVHDEQLEKQNLEELKQDMQGNPFSGFEAVGTGDAPIQMNGSFAQQLLNDDDVPEDVRKKYWWIFKKDNSLGFLDDNRFNMHMLNFDISRIDTMFCMSRDEYDFATEAEFNIMRNMFETKLNRARGSNQTNIKNERIMLQSQFHEQRHIQGEAQDSDIKSGFFKRLLSRR